MVIFDVPVYELWAPEVMRLKAEAKTWHDIAAALPISQPSLVQALRFATYGISSSRLSPGRKKHGSHGGELPMYVQHATEVARLHRRENLNFKEIARRLGIHHSTARLAKSYGQIIPLLFDTKKCDSERRF
ncbi:MAG TPA: hypothetical protein VF669_02555 [Tepidisphaeraceae bacterium]